jgi:hypothetical protein
MYGMSATPSNKLPKSYMMMTGLTSVGFLASGFAQQRTWMYIVGTIFALASAAFTFMYAKTPNN